MVKYERPNIPFYVDGAVGNRYTCRIQAGKDAFPISMKINKRSWGY